MSNSTDTSKRTCKPLHLGVMLLAHRRPWLLPLIARQIREWWHDRAIIQVTVDRPSSVVLRAVERMSDYHPRVQVFMSPLPALARGENFMQVRNFQLEQLRTANPEYACLWDDDHILESPREIKWRIARSRPDLIYIRKRFFWGDLDHYNTAIPEHRSVFLFRYDPTDRFPLDRMIHAPAAVHDNPASRAVTLASTLLDVGYLTPGERERVFNAYKQAGKIDAATMALVSPPVLRLYRPRQVQACHFHEAMRLALRDLV